MPSPSTSLSIWWVLLIPGGYLGRVLMRDRELLTIDVPAVVRETGERMPALVDRSHGKRIQAYTT